MANTAAIVGEENSLSLMEEIEALIGADLRISEQILTEELQTTNAYVRDLLQHVSRFRGKRLRPMLVLLTAQACGGVTREHQVLAAVVEMIHLATLIHDDILDDATLRRHVATVNARWNNESAVLFGDYLFTHSFRLASTLPTAEACRLIGQATNQVCEGEMTQVKERGNLELSEEAYFQILAGKTGALCAVCGQLGALYAGATVETVSAMERYGRQLGLAFQIADDVLDLVGAEKETGKTLHSDLQKQKLTLPLIRLLKTLPLEQATAVRQRLAQPDEQTYVQLQADFATSDAFAYTRHTAERFAVAAQQELQILAPSRARGLLRKIADFAVSRSY